jgi:hypothetical protein
MKTNLIPMFNRHASKNKDLIAKALTSAAGVGGALIPENLEEQITDTIIRMSPELALVEPKKIAGDVHKFNRITARPARGGGMGEAATTPVSQSATTRASVDLKIVRRKGQVTNFLSDTSEEYIDAAAYEMENHLQAHVLDLIYYILYGNKNTWTLQNSTVAQPDIEFSGLDFFISTNRTNEVLGGVVPTDLTFLDNMIDKSNRKGGARHRRAFGMSPEMLSKVSNLLTNVRLNQGLSAGGMSQVEIGGGWRLNAYRDIPIIETTATSPIEQLTSTVTLAQESTGAGGLSDDTYYVRVAPITYEGEQEADDEQSVVLNAGGATQRIRISLDAAHTTGGVSSALGYKVYLGTVSGSLTLNKIFSAFTYDSLGAPTDGNLVTTTYGYLTSTTPGNDVPVHMRNDVPFQKTGDYWPEVVYLWDLDPIQGLGKFPYTNTAGDQYNGLVTTKQLAETDDWIQFLVKSYPAIADSFEATSCWHRGLRVG